MLKLLFAFAAISAAVSTTSAGRKTFTASSKCTSSASASSSSSSNEVFVDLGIELGTKVCKDKATTEDMLKVVSETAEAIASTAVDVRSTCTGNGWAAASGAASSVAATSAKVIATAFASVSACDVCEAAVSWFAQASESAVVQSTSEAFVEVDGTDSKQEVAETIVQKLIPVFIEILVETRGGFQGTGCAAEIFADFAVGDNVVSCDVVAESWVEEVSIDAVAKAAVDTAAWACGVDELSVAAAEAVAIATARAFARAVSDANVVCIGDGDVQSCALSTTAIETVVRAQAAAWAEAWASSDTCSCTIKAQDTADAVADIVVEAASQAYADVCVEDTAFAIASSFSDAIAEQTVTAMATAIAYAVASGDDCAAFAETTACVGCVGLQERCAGWGVEGVVGCCNPYHVCMKRNRFQSICVEAGYKAPRRWDGTIQECD